MRALLFLKKFQKLFESTFNRDNNNSSKMNYLIRMD